MFTGCRRSTSFRSRVSETKGASERHRRSPGERGHAERRRLADRPARYGYVPALMLYLYNCPLNTLILPINAL